MKVSEVVEILGRYGPVITQWDHCPYEKYIDWNVTYVDEWDDWTEEDTVVMHAKRVARWIQLFSCAFLAKQMKQDTNLKPSNAERLLNRTVIELDWVDQDVAIVDGNHRFCALVYLWKTKGIDADVNVIHSYQTV